MQPESLSCLGLTAPAFPRKVHGAMKVFMRLTYGKTDTIDLTSTFLWKFKCGIILLWHNLICIIAFVESGAKTTQMSNAISGRKPVFFEH